MHQRNEPTKVSASFVATSLNTTANASTVELSDKKLPLVSATEDGTKSEPTCRVALTLGGALKVIVTAPAVVGALGSTVVAVPISLTAATLFGLTTVASALNELREAFFLRQEKPRNVSQQKNSFIGYVREKLGSPGLCARAEAVDFIYSSSLALLYGQKLESLAFIIFAIGAYAVARIAEHDYKPQPRTRLFFERPCERIWRAFPPNVRIVLSDPGASFCTGNLTLVLAGLNAPALAANVTASALLFLGAAFAVAGAMRGLFPLLKNQAVSPSREASMLGGAGDIMLGVGSLYASNPYTGVATLLWGASNILCGLKIARLHRRQ